MTGQSLFIVTNPNRAFVLARLGDAVCGRNIQACRYLAIDLAPPCAKSTRLRDNLPAPAALRPCHSATPSQARRRLRSTPTMALRRLECHFRDTLWRYARRVSKMTYAYRGLPAFASLSMAGSACGYLRALRICKDI